MGGMREAQSKLEKAAEKIAAGRPGPETENLATDMVELLGAGHQFAANAGVIQTADEMQRRLIDILA